MGGGRKKERKRIANTIHVFFYYFFMRAGKILIFIKNNMENTKYILTVRSNSV